MPTLLVATAAIAILTSVVHSVLGEILIFRHLRRGSLVPDQPAPPLKERHIRILWATWHLVSVFGFAFAGGFLWLAFSGKNPTALPLLANTAAAAFALGSALVLIGTKGRHPGWLALLAVAVLSLLASSAS